VTTQVFDPAGRLIRREQGNGSVTSYTFDCADQLTRLHTYDSLGLTVKTGSPTPTIRPATAFRWRSTAARSPPGRTTKPISLRTTGGPHPLHHPGEPDGVGIAEPHLWRQGEMVKKSSIVKVATFATPISQ
jgi:YD repeat-containing protein